MADIVVYGAGGMGKEVAETVAAVSQAGVECRMMGFLDDREEMRGARLLGYPVLGDGTWVREHPETLVALGFGHPWRRYQTVARLREANARFATIVHPGAEVSPSARLGEGTVVFAGAIISSEATVGAFCYLNYGAVISHDATIADHVCIMSHATISGNVRIGTGAFIGVGAATRQGIAIGEWALLGAGAVAVGDVPPLCVACGVPAKPVRAYASPEEMPPF